jgi:prepilin-type N-terminal cleavage/methylation domain-containing protein
MKSFKKTSGFTLIETMTALVVFAVATSGLVAMQKAASSGAEVASQQTAASNIARTFLVQLQGEVAHWPEGESWPSPTESFYLSEAGAEAVGTWIELRGRNGAFRVDEFLGNNNLDSEGSVYCVNYMIDTMENGTLVPNYTEILDTIVWKLNVRVSWPKQRRFNADGWQDCSPAAISARLVDNLGADVIELMGVGTREMAQ